jgi:hypothetical protein
MENNTQRRIHKYFFLIVFVSYFSAKFHLRECGNQQYTKRGRKKIIEEKSRKSKNYNFHFFFPMQECNLIFIVHLLLSVCDCQRKTYISVSGGIFCQNLKIKKDLPLRSWPPHAPLSRFLIFF